jgi:hypothetical protein
VDYEEEFTREYTVPTKEPVLPLINGLQASYASAGKSLLLTINRVISETCPKRVVIAEEIGINEQHLSDAINQRGKHFAVCWLPAVVRRDREHRIASLIAGWQSCSVIEKEPLTDAEYRARIEAALRRAGAAGAAIRRDALDGDDR